MFVGFVVIYSPLILILISVISHLFLKQLASDLLFSWFFKKYKHLVSYFFLHLVFYFDFCFYIFSFFLFITLVQAFLDWIIDHRYKTFVSFQHKHLKLYISLYYCFCRIAQVVSQCILVIMQFLSQRGGEKVSLCSVSLPLAGCHAHSQFRGHPEVLAAFVCRIPCSLFEALFLLRPPLHHFSSFCYWPKFFLWLFKPAGRWFPNLKSVN